MLRILSGSWQNIAISQLIGRHTCFSPVGVARLGLMSYGDIAPLHGKVRMLAVLEHIAGILYVAIAVALISESHARMATANDDSAAQITPSLSGRAKNGGHEET